MGKELRRKKELERVKRVASWSEEERENEREVKVRGGSREASCGAWM